MNSVSVNKMKSTKGFTLIELLITFSIMAMMFALLALSFNSISLNWKRASNNASSAFVEYLTIDNVISSLRSTIPFDVRSESGRTGFYFLGREDGFTAVVKNGLIHNDKLAVVRILKEQDESGLYSLYYEEAPLTDSPLIYENQTLKFKLRLPVKAGLKILEFHYFGWASYQDFLATQSDLVASPEKKWLTSYDGMRLNLQPSKIQIRMDDTVFQLNLADRFEYTIKRRVNNDGI
jgi:prepilin-type N-terminal cleavage/methylation domain-containing protein